MMSLRVRALVESTHSFYTWTTVRLCIMSRLDGGVHSIIVNIAITITSHISTPSEDINLTPLKEIKVTLSNVLRITEGNDFFNAITQVSFHGEQPQLTLFNSTAQETSANPLR